MASKRISLVCPTCQKSFEVLPSRARGSRNHPPRRFCSTVCGLTKHGASIKGQITPEFNSWMNMRRRCESSYATRYDLYGGRGIDVCAGWESFEQFLADMGPRPGAGYSVDRIDTNGGYWCGRCAACLAAGQPANCRWATRQEQANNLRHNRYLEYDGRRLTFADWSRETGISRAVIASRVNIGWPPERVLNAPLKPPGAVFIEYQGRRQSVAKWARETGFPAGVITSRIKLGWAPDRILTEPVYQAPTIEYQGRSLNCTEWARETGLATHVIRKRLKAGWTPERILTTPVASREPR